MTSMRELFSVPPRSSKNFIALNVRNVHKKQDKDKRVETCPKPNVRILKEANGPTTIRNPSKLPNYKSNHSSVKHKPKAYRHAGCQTVDIENDESLLEDGVIRYPSSKWRERSTHEHQFKSIALQTEHKNDMDRNVENNSEYIVSEDVNKTTATFGVCSELKESQNNGHISPVYDQHIEGDFVKAPDQETESLMSINKNQIKEISDVDKTVVKNTTKLISRSTNSVNENRKIISGSTNSLNENRRNNATSQCKLPGKHKRGAVPRYLIEKKLEKEREERRIQEEAERTGILDPDCPPGHILLPTEKRLEQLEFLKKNYKNLINELNRIPVRNDSLKIRQHRVLVEKELDKLEDAIKLFSKEKLFVKP